MADYIASGAIPIEKDFPEAVYAKALLGCALYDDQEQLIAYVTGKE